MTSNRTIAYCPRCGREVVIGRENELVCCGLCAMKKVAVLDKKKITGKDILKVREKRKMTREKVALAIGIEPPHLDLIEKGKKPISSRVYKWWVDNRTC